MGEVVRQGFLTKKTYMYVGRKVTLRKWKPKWVVLTRIGIFFFDYRCVEADKATGYILLSAQNFTVTDLSNNAEKKFQFAIKTKQDHSVFACHSFQEKQLWIESIELARKERIVEVSSPRQQVSNPSQWKMKATITVKVFEAKELKPYDSSLMGAKADPYLKLCIGNTCHSTSVQHATLNPKWNEEFKFETNRLPVDLIVAMYDYDKIGRDDIIAQLRHEITGAGVRSDKLDWFVLRPVKIGSEAVIGKLKMSIQCRYDEETQKKVTFGVSIADLMARESHKDLLVPDIVYKCIKSLYKRCLSLKGIFRVSGNNNKIYHYEQLFDREGVKADFVNSEDPHVVSNLLKLWLRELPEPIIPYSQFKAVISAAAKNKELKETIAELRQLLKEIPEVNYRTLNVICCLLFKITENSDQTLMKPLNLAIVFGPVFFAPPPDANENQQGMLQHLPTLSTAAEVLIAHYYEVFGVDKNGKDPLQDLVDRENKLIVNKE